MSGIARERRIQEIVEFGGIKVEFKSIPESEAKGVIEGYVRAHLGCITSEIIENLGLDPSIVVEALKLLEEKGKVKSEEVE